MMLLGMGIVTVPYLVLFATKDLGMTTTQYGLLLALAAVSQFVVNSIIARFLIHIMLIGKSLLLARAIHGCRKLFYLFLCSSNLVIYSSICNFPRFICSSRNYMLLQESINISSSRDRVKFANTVLRSMFSLGFLFGPFIGSQLIELNGYSGLFGER